MHATRRDDKKFHQKSDRSGWHVKWNHRPSTADPSTPIYISQLIIRLLKISPINLLGIQLWRSFCNENPGGLRYSPAGSRAMW
jgi:hypothetical protein